jgi:DNA-directed RNA polymerase specialized sigma24 family protein
MEESFNAEFARLRPQLRSFLLRMTASAEDAV